MLRKEHNAFKRTLKRDFYDLSLDSQNTSKSNHSQIILLHNAYTESLLCTTMCTHGLL